MTVLAEIITVQPKGVDLPIVCLLLLLQKFQNDACIINLNIVGENCQFGTFRAKFFKLFANTMSFLSKETLVAAKLHKYYMRIS